MKIIRNLMIISVLVLLSTGIAFGFGTDYGEHCWQGISSGVLIKHQVAKLGNLYNLNGNVAVTNQAVTEIWPAYGTAFYDDMTNTIKAGYTIVWSSTYKTALLLLDPKTLNGTKILFNQDGTIFTEDVIHISCP